MDTNIHVKTGRRINIKLHLVLKIGSSWDVPSLIEFLNSINFWYNFLLIAHNLEVNSKQPKLNKALISHLGENKQNKLNARLSVFFENPTSYNLSKVIAFFPLQMKLRLKSFNYNSPGSIDLFGVGEILKQVKEIIFEFANYRAKKRLTWLDIEEKEENIKSQRLSNLEKELELMKNYDIPNKTIKSVENKKVNDKQMIDKLRKNHLLEDMYTYEKEDE